MPRKNKIVLRTGSTTPSAADFVVGEPAWDSSAGKLFLRNAAGSMVEIGAGSSVSFYAASSSFPGTGASSTIYLDSSSNRMYRWDSTGNYVEIGTIGGIVDADGGGF